jgi:hypothetical protein
LDTLKSDKSFEQRRYETIRRNAPAIGWAGIRGALAAAEAPVTEALERRRKTELLSTLAEGIKPEQVRSIIDTNYKIPMVRGKLVADDGEPIQDLLDRNYNVDKALAARDNFYETFLLKQDQYDIDELHEWEAMVRGETDYNTIITFSGYREEYDDGTPESHEKLLRAGQKPYWRRGMFRVAHAKGGKAHIFSYSIDNCSNELMREVARREFGYEFKAENSLDMLGERLQLKIDDDSWRFIAPRLVAHGDKFLSEKHGGEWKHGYDPAAGVRRAQSFVESQTQIVDSLLAIDSRLAIRHSTYEGYAAEWEQKLYDAMALLEKRLDFGKENEAIVDYGSSSSGAGAAARAEGKVYDACGMVIGGNALNGSQAGTGEQSGEKSLMELRDKKIACANCNEKVIVPHNDLEAGKLSCSECGYWLDVCTGKNGFTKGAGSRASEPSGMEILADWFRQEKQDSQIKKMAERRAQAELGGNTTYLDKKRYEKQLRENMRQAA